MRLAFVYMTGRYEERTMLFIMVGILESFTNFSAFLFDAIKFLEAGKPVFAFGYVKTNIGASLVALVVGVTTVPVFLA